jgi:hypothetical protein
VTKAMASPRVFNLTISQSPAPRGPLYLFGCELQEVFSVVPIAQGHALAIGLVRYRQELFFGGYADPEAFPEVREIPALLEAEMHALGRAARGLVAARSSGEQGLDRGDRAVDLAAPAQDRPGMQRPSSTNGTDGSASP